MRFFVGCLVAWLAMAGTVFGEGFLGFRLLDLDGRKVKWRSADGSAAIVTYAFVGTDMNFPKARNCAGMVSLDTLLETSHIPRAAFEAEVRAAFSMWEDVANIDFRRTDTPSEAGILIGAQQQPVGYAFANVDYRPATT